MDDLLDDDMDDLLDRSLPTDNDRVKPSHFDPNDPQPPKYYLDSLSRHFGHNKFRPMQWRIIRSIIEDKRDNCVIMATGYGKSLCYQFPAVYLNTVTLVISPLISLMEDQVLSLNLSNIPACLLGTAQKKKTILDEIFNCEYRIVYVTPEYITGDAGEYLMKRLANHLTLIAIDEAHCVSQWGHDFRPAYRSLGFIRQILPSVPILAVTATATANVREDITRSLHLRNAQCLCTGFDRPNLEFKVFTKSEVGIWTDLRPYVTTQKPDGSIIIYCLTRKQTEEIVELLQSHNIECGAYHAGLGLKERKTVHEEFVRDQKQVIVATVAFGMGIDKPDVRLVIHYGMAKDIESYYQEAGRAGRDGQPAKCVMFYSRADYKTHEILRELSNSNVHFKKNLEDLSKKMQQYLNTRECRRQFILQYFEGANTVCQPRAHCCDNCSRTLSSVSDESQYEGIDAEGKFDFGNDARLLLQAVQTFNGKGISKPILLLRGSQNKQLHVNYYNNPNYGKGKDKPEEWWKCLNDLLEAEKFITVKKTQNVYAKSKFAIMHTILLQEKANTFLNSGRAAPLKLQPPVNMFKYLKRKKPTYLYEETSPVRKVSTAAISASSQQLHNVQLTKDLTQDLIKSLLRKRSELASGFDVMPYMIASNLALTQLATKRPLNLDEIRVAEIDGFSDVKITKYGKVFLQCIQEKLNIFPDATTTSADATETLEDVLERNPFDDTKCGPKKVLVYQNFQKGCLITDIARDLSLASSTVMSYLVDTMKCGFKFTRADLMRLGVDDTLFQTIKAVIPDLRDDIHVKLLMIKEKLPPEMTYDQIKLVVVWCQIRQHARNQGTSFQDDGAKNTKPGLDIFAFKPGKSISDEGNSNDQYFTPQEDMEVEEKPPADENLWGEDDDSIDFAEIDMIMSNLDNQQPKVASGLSQSEQATCSKASDPVATVALKPQLSKLQATKRVIYEKTSSDEETNDLGKDEPTTKRAMPGWLGKSSAEPKPSKFQFKKKSSLY